MFRWRLIVTGASLWLLAGACTVKKDTPPESEPGAVRIVPTELGRQVLLDPSGALLAQAVREHEPTEDEAKLASFAYSFAAGSVASGAIDQRVATGDLEAMLVELARQYPSLFRLEPREATSTAPAPLRARSEGASEIDCNTTCSLPLDGIAHLATVEALKKLAGQVVGAVGDEKAAAIADAVAEHFALVDSLNGAAIKKEVQAGSAAELLKSIGDVVVTSSSTIKAAAEALGGATPLLETVAHTAGLIGLLLTAEEVREVLAEAREKQALCTAKRREMGCNEDPACDKLKCGVGEECRTCKAQAACMVSRDTCAASDPCDVVGAWTQACNGTATCTGCGSLPAQFTDFEIDGRLAWRGGTFTAGDDLKFVFDPKSCELTRTAVFDNSCLGVAEHTGKFSDGATIEASWSCQSPDTNACLCSGETSCVWQKAAGKS